MESKVDTDTLYFDSKTSSPSDECTEGNITGCNYGWLYDRTSLTCELTGCNNNNDVETSGYWTTDARISTNTAVWGVKYDGEIYFNYVTNRTTYGIRPVITVSKSSIN